MHVDLSLRTSPVLDIKYRSSNEKNSISHLGRSVYIVDVL